MLLYGISNRPLDAVVEAHNRVSASAAPAESGQFRPLSPKRERDTEGAAAAQQRKLARLDAAARLLTSTPLAAPEFPPQRYLGSPRRND